jgi:hypothetical protein
MKTKNTYIYLALVFCSLFLNALLAPFWSLYADDWQQITVATELSDLEFREYFINSFLFNPELRPLRALEWLLKRILSKAFGFTALYALQAFILGVSACLIFKIFKTRFSTKTSFLISLFFLLSPIDSTSSWLATFHWKCSLLLALLAVIFVLKNNYVATCLSIIGSLFFHEAPIGMFCLAPLIAFKANLTWAHKLFRNIFWKSLACFFVCFLLYIIWRKFLVPIYMPDFRMQAFKGMHNLNIGSLVIEHCKRTLYGFMSVFVLPWGIMLWKLPIWNFMLSGLLALYLSFFFKTPLIRLSFKKAINLLIIGVVSIPFGFWLALYQAPPRHIGWDSKLNLPVCISFACIFVSLFFIFQNVIKKFFSNSLRLAYITNFILIFLVGLLVNVKLIYQLDYVQAKIIQNDLFSRVKLLNPASQKVILFSENYDHHRMAIEPVAPYGGPWSGKYTVYPKSLIQLKNKTADTSEIYIDGQIAHTLKRTDILVID